MSRRVVREGEDPDEQLRQRDQNRMALRNMVNEFADFKREVKAQFQTVQSEKQQMQSQLQELQRELQGLRGGLQSVQGSQQDIHQLKSELQSVKGAQHEVQGMKSKLQSMEGATKDINNLKSELQSVKGAHQDVQGMKSKLQTMEANNSKLTSMEDRLQAKQSEHQRQLNELKQGVQSNDVLTSLQSKTDLVSIEFSDLKKQIYDRGLLAPKVQAPEDPEEPPPVGAVTLGEDVFTARLLIHLGFMKARKDAFQADSDNEGMVRARDPTYASLSDDASEVDVRCLAIADADEFDEDAYGPEDFIDDDNVHGITDVDITEGGPGFWKVTHGWLFICITTFSLQVLVVLILIQGAKDAGEGCMAHPMPRFSYSWWLLHLSKGVAIGVSGVLMGQELMDVINYAMVSHLVEPHINYEAIFVAASRILLAGLIAFANVIIFGYLKHPATVWINMTALAFIGELGTGMLDVARRGVFGHHIMKTMTALNFELTFVTDYPAWFGAVRALTLSIAACFVLAFAGIAFATPDRVCHHSGAFTNGTHVLLHHLLGGDEGGHGGGGASEGGGGGGGAGGHHHR